jgi:hypothetical protein
MTALELQRATAIAPSPPSPPPPSPPETIEASSVDASSVVARPIRAEQAIERRFYVTLAALCVLGFLYVNRVYWVPAHPGVDQNGYLVGGRMFAENLTMRLRPTTPSAASSARFDPHQFVGRMWVGADLGTSHERYYPKYPIGYPLLLAIALWIGQESWGPLLVYWINPIAMTLAVAATFLLVRLVARSFWAFCAAVVFALSPIIMGHATNPNSHATATCFATWGMYLLMRWWMTTANEGTSMKGPSQRHECGAWKLALWAGLFLGYTATIRYTEGLLVLPLLIVILLHVPHWRERRFWTESLAAIVGWLIPVGIVVAHNLASMGRLTGYDGTNESLGFSWEFAADNWETTLRHLGTVALYFIFPFSVVGLLAMVWWSWRLGLLVASWALPCLLVYTFYYWAPDPTPAVQQGVFIGYMRFFTTILPALVLSAFWFFDRICAWIGEQPEHTARPWALRMTEGCIGLIVLLCIAVHARNSALHAEIDQNNRLMLKYNTEQVLATAPAGAVLFAQDNNMLHHLQFAREYKLYTGETFNRGFVDSLAQMDPDEPQGWDPGRRDALYQRLKHVAQPQLDEMQRRLVREALDSGRRVFVLAQRRDNEPPAARRRAGSLLRGSFPGVEVLRRMGADQFDIDVLSAWSTPLVRPELPATAAAARPRRQRAEARGDRRAVFWQMLEVVPKPTTQPTQAAPAPLRRQAAPAAPARPTPTTKAMTRPAKSPNN